MERLLRKSDLKPYQRRACNHQTLYPSSMIWLFMGAGKTAISLTTISHLIQHQAIRSALVVGPLRVIQSVWEQEGQTWEHLRHLRFSNLHGSTDNLINRIHRPADIYLINYESLEKLYYQLKTYLLDRGHPLPFDMLVVDEVSKVKNPDTVRVRSLEPLLAHFRYRTGLTGTPATNGLADLFGQYYVIDSGERLGVDKNSFISAYFTSSGYGGFQFEPAPGAAEIIYKLISDITLEMAQEDYLKLPDLITQDITIELPPKARKQYDMLENLFWLELDEHGILEVQNEVSKINKLLQFSNGAVYTNTETKDWEKVHDAKLDALDDILEEAGGNPILLGYNFRIDATRIKQRFKHAVDLTTLDGQEFIQAIHDFQEGRIRLLMGHPASMGHGVDGLQRGCSNIVWFGVPWSLELFLQLNARVHRQGMSDKPVTCYRILCQNTMDQAVSIKLAVKEAIQKELRHAVKTIRDSDASEQEITQAARILKESQESEVTELYNAINQYRKQRGK